MKNDLSEAIARRINLMLLKLLTRAKQREVDFNN